MADPAGRHEATSPEGSVPAGSTGAVIPSDATHALDRLHLAVESVLLPQAAGVEPVRLERERVLQLLETYTLPRVEQREAPLVVVIGGPTGAGKSTLTNSLIGTRVSHSGVMRPTTREPVMVFNPADAAALRTLGLLEPDASETARGPDQPTDPASVPAIHPRPVPNRDVVPGLVVVDSPDLDSRLDSNREIAGRLLTVADLWMFVTTGTDYADAMSWTLLTEAAQRGISVAVVLNRLRERESTTVRNHFAILLRDAGLAHAYIFSLPEARLMDDRLPLQLVLTMQKWLEKQARGSRERQTHRTRAWDGTLDQIVASAGRLADAIDDQVVLARQRQVDVEGLFSTAREAVRERCTNGALVSQELLAAWLQAEAEPVAGPPSSGMFRRRPREGPQTDTERHVAITEALRSELVALLHEQVGLAVFRSRRLHADSGNDPRTAARAARLADDFTERAQSAVQTWLHQVHRRAHGEDADVRGAVRDPLTLTVATSAVLERIGHSGGKPGDQTLGDVGSVAQERDTELDRQVRALVERRLAEHSRLADAETLSLDAWLDLVSALTVVVNQEESRQIRSLEAVPISGDVAVLLRGRAAEVAALRSRPAAGE